ncbi:uncharacterized protein LOC128959100 [Oppia nitens]|uniref:uncharacterized protein LOC128959100 n=1 Tax=Oppia nitens TaxID=1686743 RepID=UPI0023D98117|nr:uncharacterized protein LOC128959100 [Oppia nitens]
MNLFLVLCLLIVSVFANDEYGGGGGGDGGYESHHQSVKAPAFVLPIPEIGLSFDKIPLFLPLPKIVLRKNPTLISKPLVLPLSHGFDSHGFGGFGGFGDLFGGGGGGHGKGFSISFGKGGHGGGSHGW